MHFQLVAFKGILTSDAVSATLGMNSYFMLLYHTIYLCSVSKSLPLDSFLKRQWNKHGTQMRTQDWQNKQHKGWSFPVSLQVPHSLVSVYEELESIKQPVLLPPSKQTTQNLHKTHSLPHEIQYSSLLLISLNPVKKSKRKVVPHIKCSQRDTQLYIAKSNDQSQHFCIISSNLINQVQKEKRRTKTQQQ